MLDHSCQVQRAPLSERGDDLYETPDVAVHALLRVEKLPEVIWEPACGPGRIVNVLRTAGHKVYATDLVNYGLDDSGKVVVTFTPPGYVGRTKLMKFIERCAR